MTQFNLTNLRFELVTDLIEALKLWDEFSPNELFYDLKDIRLAFYKSFSYPVRFYVCWIGEKKIGLLPLQYNTEKKFLEFFGGDYMEDNRVYFKSGFENLAPRFYEQINEPSSLELISAKDEFGRTLPLQDFKYVLQLAKHKSLDEYILATFSASTAKKMRSHYRQIEEQKVEILKNNFEDIELLFDFNIQRFGAGSSYHYPRRKEIFRDLLKTSVDTHLLTFVINGVKEAVALTYFHNGTHKRISAGVKMGDWTHIMTYVNLKQIEYAISLGAKEVDAAMGDYGWKEKWGFEKVPEHILKISKS